MITAPTASRTRTLDALQEDLVPRVLLSALASSALIPPTGRWGRGALWTARPGCTPPVGIGGSGMTVESRKTRGPGPRCDACHGPDRHARCVPPLPLAVNAHARSAMWQGGARPGCPDPHRLAARARDWVPAAGGSWHPVAQHDRAARAARCGADALSLQRCVRARRPWHITLPSDVSAGGGQPPPRRRTAALPTAVAGRSAAR
jgi:hypothetical protein